MGARSMMIAARLLAGETVENKEGGNSMVPLIHSRQPVTIEPVDPTKLEPGDIVFVKVRGRFFTHLVKALRGNEVQIGNNHGHINGWAKSYNVFGIITAVDGVARPGARAKVRVPG